MKWRKPVSVVKQQPAFRSTDEQVTRGGRKNCGYVPGIAIVGKNLAENRSVEGQDASAIRGYHQLWFARAGQHRACDPYQWGGGKLPSDAKVASWAATAVVLEQACRARHVEMPVEFGFAGERGWGADPFKADVGRGHQRACCEFPVRFRPPSGFAPTKDNSSAPDNHPNQRNNRRKNSNGQH